MKFIIFSGLKVLKNWVFPHSTYNRLTMKQRKKEEKSKESKKKIVEEVGKKL